MQEINKYISRLVFTGSVILLGLSSCKKDKQNFEYDNRKVTDARKNSSVRIVNLSTYSQVLANGDTLTNFVVRVNNDPMSGKYPGTLYFPEDGRLGSTWTIPQGLLNQGKANIQVEVKAFQAANTKTLLPVEEDQKDAMDYYLLPTENELARPSSLPRYLKIKRDVTSPTNPANFKIRILNLAGTVKNDLNQENLVGPVSLVWADGTPLSAKTNHIAPGTASEYIELPYGAAQLKVLTAAGTQISGTYNGTVDPKNSEMISEETGAWPPLTSHLTYAPLKTYLPGGVYTVVVSPRNFRFPYYNGAPGDDITGYQNAFRIINDVAEQQNITYAKMQAIHTFPGVEKINVLVNGKALGDQLSYGNHSDYAAFVSGSYKIEARDVSGNVLAGTEIKLEPNSNYSLWVYPDASGKAQINAVPNDLSSRFGQGGTDDGTYSGFKSDFPVNVRFLNLCPDIPNLSFTRDNGQSFQTRYPISQGAVSNLLPGVFPIESPYISLAKDIAPYQILAFRSTPVIVPGTWASDIPVLTGQNLIARPALYVRGVLPNHEPGIYTIALIGSTKATGAYKAKMIILKHNK